MSAIRSAPGRWRRPVPWKEAANIMPTNAFAKGLEAAKKEYAKRRGLDRVPSTADMIKLGAKGVKKGAVRSASGVTVIAIMVRPGSCPYDCAYCPTSSLAAKSYTGYEPAARRARQNDFDAGRQVRARIRTLEETGHSTEKCELIVMGGTFNVLPRQYMDSFIKSAIDGFNGTESEDVLSALGKNESAKHRVIGITFETRPDCASKLQVSQLVDYGATRIELGVQSLDEQALARVSRGHGVAQVATATANCKDALLKVGYHIMPGLYSTPEKDELMFRRLFDDQSFRPDMLKIYPTLVIPGTELHRRWERGEFKPYDTREAARAIAAMVRHVPPYCRIMRIDRDIPIDRIAAGVSKSNLRELVEAELSAKGWTCNDIRNREIGLRGKPAGRVEIHELEYEASGGREIFISADNEDGDLVGYLRLRKPKDPYRTELQGNTAGIRELRVLGTAMALGARTQSAAQHKKIGSELLGKAEEKAGEFGADKLAVISGVGARRYYYGRGFSPDGGYLSKEISKAC